MYKIRFTGRFRKDYNIICKRGYDLNLLKAVIRKLTINGQVPENSVHTNYPGNTRTVGNAILNQIGF